MHGPRLSQPIPHRVVGRLVLNCGGLSILIHPNTSNPKRDHTVDPIWIGRALGVHGEVLGEEDEAEEALEANTEPTLGCEEDSPDCGPPNGCPQ